MKKKLFMSVLAMGVVALARFTKKPIFYFSICLLLLSCSNNSNQTELCDINISGYEDNTMDFASLASKVDTLYFYVGEEFASVSMIKNIYMTDSLLYVSDFNNCISS